MPRDDLIDMDECVEVQHREFLSEFDVKVWPIYDQHGFSKDAALLSWQLNTIYNKLEAVQEAIEEVS